MDSPGSFIKPLKTYVNTSKVTEKSPAQSIRVNRNAKMPLTTKKAVELLLEGTLKYEVCRFCLELSTALSELDQIVSVAGRGAMYDVTLRDMVATVHPFKIHDEPYFPNKICNKCVNKAISSYLFAQKCEQAARALRNCFDDISEKLNKLDPLQRVQKRGRHKLHPNHNKLYTEHQLVMDYAEPIRNLINTDSVSYTNESAMSDLECKRCWQLLPNIESLVNHEKTHPTTMWYHCRQCGKSFRKCNQLKKHLKSCHDPLNMPEKDKFECKKCGFNSDNHILHLQHVETHKFQTVVEHMVEKKMDKLCAVCYDKDKKLVELDKVIALHGGYPELTGERSLYNILGATLPENKSYKHQELFVPCKANIITITKKLNMGFAGFNKKNQAKTSTDSSFMVKQHLDLSHPVIISTENIYCNDLYLFTFSDPLNLFEIEDNKMDYNTPVINDSTDSHEEIDKTNDVNFDDSKLNYNTPTENNFSNKDEVDLTFDGHVKDNVPEFVKHIAESGKSKEEIINHKELSVEETVCKVCWIYDKPVCEKCIGTKTNLDGDFVKTVGKVEGNTDNTSVTCKFCWIFKNAGRCDYCKKPVKRCVNYTSKNDKTHANIYSKLTAIVSQGKKRKIFEEDIEVQAKKSKWHCAICLTSNNTDRETCVCCDSSITNENLVKFNFGTNNNSFLNQASKSEDVINSSTIQDAIEIAKNNDDDILVGSEDIKETQYPVKFIEQSNNIKTYNVENMDTTITLCKEMPITAANISVFNKHQEQMDVEELVNNESLDILPPSNVTPPNLFPDITFGDSLSPLPSMDSNIPNIKPTAFQFNVGSGPVESKGRDIRKYKRPLRRNAAFHKS